MELKKKLEEELEEVGLFLARPDVVSFRVIDEDGFPSTDTEMVCQVRSAKNRQAGLCDRPHNTARGAHKHFWHGPRNTQC